MKWINHGIIAGSTTAVIEPMLVPVAVIGSTAPDWLETIANKFLKLGFEHRQETHYLVFWLLFTLFFGFFWDINGIFTAFFWGGLTHILADSLTVSGVSLYPNAESRFKLFGGRLRTGDRQEYFFSFTIFLICVLIILATNHSVNNSAFVPFFYNWGEMYHAGIIDASEYKANRFRIF
jgi:inner membrane protein